eukprot:TRINITY_DN1406_c0_g1_i2.p1 TRINITY_DN1406_c0_g1~~TRINITY_DN1406_c0_g1_i2.p1  ORF type:complete len:467 (+),score=174.18 TRINITY_DN1406_c0_g1_i2:48-1448(+)
MPCHAPIAPIILPDLLQKEEELEPVLGVPIDICLASPTPPMVKQTTKGRRKTKLCKLWLENRCRRRRCPFAHGEAELRILVTEDKKEERPWMDNLPEEACEVEALGVYMGPNSIQRSQRMAMRDLVQHYVMENIEREATTKVTGPCAVNLDVFDTDLDLVVEGVADAYPGEYQTRLATVLSSIGVMSCIHMKGDQPFVTFDSCQMTVVNTRWASSYFKVNVTFRSGSCPERKEVSVMQTALNKYKAQRAVVPVVLALMRSAAASTCSIPEKALLIMCLAFLEHLRTHPGFYNLRWVVTEFFRFYSDFDFRRHEICVQDTPFPLKEVETDEVVIHDIMCDVNTAGRMDIACLKGCFGVIHDKLIQNNSIGRSLFAGLVSEDLLRHRNRVLGEQTPEVDPSSPSQVVINSINSLTDALADPANASLKSVVQSLIQGKSMDITEEVTPTAALLETATRRLLALLNDEEM